MKRRKVFPCGHRGYGQWCHRCAEADRLEEMLKEGKQYTTHHWSPKKGGGHKKQQKKWTQKEMREEAERLREEGKS